MHQGLFSFIKFILFMSIVLVVYTSAGNRPSVEQIYHLALVGVAQIYVLVIGETGSWPPHSTTSQMKAPPTRGGRGQFRQHPYGGGRGGGAY